MNSQNNQLNDNNLNKSLITLEIQDWLLSYVAEALELTREAIDVNVPFERYGLDSSAAIVLTGDLSEWLGINLEPELLFDYQTIAELTDYLVQQVPSDTTPVTQETKADKLKIVHLLETGADEANIYPLSRGQQALWFLYKLAPESPAYNVAFPARICSEIDILALRCTFEQIRDRHPLLRTNFKEQNGAPVQEVNVDQELCFEEFTATDCGENELKQKVIKAYQRPFDLENGSVFRVSLFKRSPQDYVLLLTMHHIVCDGWSVWMLLDELRVLYPAIKDGTSGSLPNLEFSYQDYIHWQTEMLASKEGETLAKYWQEKLAGELPILNLPTDRPRPAIQTYNGAGYSFQLDRDLLQGLKQLGQSEGASLYMILLSAYQVLLHRYTGQEDILVGSPMKCRNQPEFQRIFGYFVNPVVLRGELKDNPTFQEFLHQVRHTVLGAIAHQDYPFTLLVDQLEPERNPSRTPIFQTMFVLQKPQQSGDILDLFAGGETEGRVNWGGLELERFDIPQQEGQFDLALEMMETEDSILGVFHYNTDLFDAATIERLEGHFQTLLRGIVAQPQQQIGYLPLLTEAERHQILVEWNDTKADYPKDKCIHQLFEEQVEKTPDAVAVVFAEQQLTYRELNEKANQLAHYLQSLGVKPEVLVGICVERSLEMVVGLLGILKAGGAYVPLDPNYPQDRLAYMLSDAQVPVLLTQEKLRAELPENEARIVGLDSDWGIIEQESRENPDSGLEASNLAYVIYTSGSTGKPKGVLLQHQGLCNLALAQIKAFGVRPDSHILQFASFSFDASISEIVMTLCCGVQLYLCKQESLLPGNNLTETVNEYGITHITLPPSALTVMSPDELSSLENIIVAGEACSPELVANWSQRRRFINAYGPTEYTVCTTIAECSNTTEKPPIGKPITNTQVYILDSYLQPVPIGVAGELHIGGVGIARGYLNRPDLTRDKFIPNPFNNDPDSRLYKTGDLVRYLPDGNIDFLGRIDQQVKIRGFRIELGEIEANLKQHPQLQEAVVIPREDQPGNKRLVAYLVSQEVQPSMGELRNFLSEKLPDYMIPAAFVFLESIPLTPNGKVDRKALPTPEQSRSDKSENFILPRNNTEHILAQIWAEVLGLKQVGIQENFFELGGDSILSIQVVAKANQIGLKLTPKDILGNQTIAELAKVATKTSRIETEQGLVTGIVPLTPIQEWFFAQDLSENHHFNQSVLLEVAANLDPDILKEVVKILLEHHDALRLKFTNDDGSWQQFNLATVETIPFSILDLSNLELEKQQSVIESESAKLQTSLNLSEGKLVQVTFFNLGKDRPSRLLIIIHHLAVDGVSWRILLEDLATVYQQLRDGETIKLPSKTTSFKYWSEKLREYAQSQAAVAELDYWLSQLPSELIPLPVDYNSDKHLNTVASSAHVSVSLSEEETRSLLQEVPQAYNTQINDVLLTALLQSFAQWTGESSLLIDLEAHGREELFEDIDLSRTVGWFTSMFPVILTMETNNFPGEVLKSIKEQLRFIPKHGIGYGIIKYLNKEAIIRSQLQAIPQPEISFNYLGQLDQISSIYPLLGFAKESSGLLHSPRGNRNHLLEINAFIQSGKLQIHWTYSKEVHQENTIETVAQNFKESLQAIISHCQSSATRGYTPSDFPLAQLSVPKLEQILSITGNNVEDIYPLSPPQQDIFFDQLAHPESGVYFIQCTFAIDGDLNISAWKQAWEKTLARHTILRTCFVWEDLDEPLQIVHKSVNLPWVEHNWKSLSQVEQQNNLEAFLKTDRAQGFTLNQAPLMRCTLIELNDQQYRFVWSHHHLLLDGWSFPIILQEVFTSYEALNKGENLHFHSPIPYRNYLAWLQQQDLSNAQLFWCQKLKDFQFPNRLKLKSSIDNLDQQDRQQTEYEEKYISLSANLTSALQSLVREHRLTLSSLFQGVWAILIHIYTGQKDIIFGNAVSGRSVELPGIESMVGLFSNMLPVRVQIDEHLDILPWLQKLQTNQIEMEQYSHTSIQKIKQWNNLPQDIPLFVIVTAFENYPLDGIEFLEKMSLHIDNISIIEIPRFIDFMGIPGQKLSLGIEYYPNYFNETTISEMVQELQTLLEKIVANPQQKISAFLSHN